MHAHEHMCMSERERENAHCYQVKNYSQLAIVCTFTKFSMNNQVKSDSLSETMYDGEMT